MPERPRPSLEKLQKYADDFNASRNLDHFGVRIDFPDADTVRCTIDPIRPEQRGGWGDDAVNGGVLAAMFDLSIGAAAALVDPTRAAATVQLSMSFERALRGSKLIAEGKVDHFGGSTLFASAVIKDDHGRICARAQGLVRCSNREWPSKTSPAIR